MVTASQTSEISSKYLLSKNQWSQRNSQIFSRLIIMGYIALRNPTLDKSESAVAITHGGVNYKVYKLDNTVSGISSYLR